MAPGPPNLEANRFALLDVQPKRKRKGNTESPVFHFPELPTPAKQSHPKFIILQATDPNKPLSQYSCFALYKAINLISKDVLSISDLRDGNLLLLVKDSNIANKFIASKELHGICSISAKFHDNLNSVKGTIYAPFLINVSVEEIVQELNQVGVTAAYKFQKKLADGTSVPNGVILLTFDLYHLPDRINIAWNKVDVRQYIPSPMRCHNCQLLGHTTKFCKRSPSCVQCNLPPHNPAECTRIFCANCSDQHPSSSNQCPKYIQSKEVLKIKITKKCSVREALKTYKQLNPAITPSTFSYAAVASQAVNSEHTASTSPQQKNKNSSHINNTNKNTDNQNIRNNANSNKTSLSNPFQLLPNQQKNNNSYNGNASTQQTNKSPSKSNINKNYNSQNIKINSQLNSLSTQDSVQPVKSPHTHISQNAYNNVSSNNIENIPSHSHLPCPNIPSQTGSSSTQRNIISPSIFSSSSSNDDEELEEMQTNN